MVQFRQAVRKQKKGRVLLDGPTGSGKTWTALAIARGIIGPDARLAVIDTEHGSAALYADQFGGFDTLELTNFAPEKYVEALAAAAAAQYEAVVIDSTTHEWAGTGGILEFVDKTNNKFGDGWKKATPKHNSFIEAILAAPFHIVATVRSKMSYEVTTASDGKTTIKRIGVQPTQRDGFDYEFDVTASLDNAVLTVTKTRAPYLRGARVVEPGLEFGASLRDWLSTGEAWVAPNLPRAFVVGGRTVQTAGLTLDTYVALAALGRSVETTRGAGAAAKVLSEATGKALLAELTEEEGQAAVAALTNAAVNGGASCA